MIISLAGHDTMRVSAGISFAAIIRYPKSSGSASVSSRSISQGNLIYHLYSK